MKSSKRQFNDETGYEKEKDRELGWITWNEKHIVFLAEYKLYKWLNSEIALKIEQGKVAHAHNPYYLGRVIGRL
jgi:hypothetical protein